MNRVKNSNPSRGILDELATARLREYLSLGRPALAPKHGPDPGFLFTGTRSGERIDRHYWEVSIKQYAKLAGVTFDVTNHTFRHSFASLMARSPKLTAWDLQDMMGHVRIDSTAHYVKGVGAYLETAWEAARPRYLPKLPAGMEGEQ